MADTFARMKQLIGTTAEWAANNIVLGRGELGIESTAGRPRLKIGDGAAPYSALPYFDPSGAEFVLKGGDTMSGALTVPGVTVGAGASSFAGAVNLGALATATDPPAGDSDSTVPTTRWVQTLTAGAVSGSHPKGAWNASTNSPTLVSSVGVAGDFYIVSVAGSTSLNGISTWTVGDTVLFSGTVWQRIPQAISNAQVIAGLGYTPVNKAGDTMTGTLTMSGDIIINHALGAAPAATSRIPIDHALTVTGASAGNSDVRSQRRILQPSGAFGFAKLYGDYTGIISDVTAGNILEAWADHRYLWNNAAAGITAGDVYFGHIVVRGNGNITTGSVYRAGQAVLDTGTGIVPSLYGFVSSIQGHATRVTDLYQFATQDASASASVTGYYGNVAAGAGKWDIRVNGGANNLLGGKTRIGHATAPTQTFEVIAPAGAGSGTKLITMFLGTSSGGPTGTEIAIDIDPTGNGVGQRSAQIGSRTTAAGDANLIFRVSNAGAPADRLVIDAAGSTRPGVDNTAAVTCGTASFRWSTVYAATGTINTSDATEKTNVRELDDTEVAIAQELAAQIKLWQWREAIDRKGREGARLHAGWSAQSVAEVFARHGRNPFSYGCVGFDEIEIVETYEVTVKRPKMGKKTILEQSIEILDGRPMRVTREVEADEPIGSWQPVYDDSGPVMTRRTVPGEGPGDPAVTVDEPVLHFVPELEEVTEQRERTVPALDAAGRPKVRFNVRPDQLNALISFGLAKLIRR